MQCLWHCLLSLLLIIKPNSSAALGLQSWLSRLDGHNGSGRFLLISAPRNAQIAYVELPEDGSFANLRPQTLIHGGLHHPQGLAVDKRRRILYVADPDSKRILGYQLAVEKGSLRVVGGQRIVAQHAESRWVAVDESGNVFFSVEPDSRILKVAGHRAMQGNTEPELVYSGNSLMQVSQPGGVAVDGVHLYWTNKHFGTKAGSVVKASEHFLDAGPPTDVSVLAMNAEKSYGICLASMGNVFFTDSSTYLYGVKKSGGKVEEVSDRFMKPRGCAWDGDGTVFVADRGANSVYAFPSNMAKVEHAKVEKAFHFEDAFGLAVLGAGSRLSVSFLVWALPVLGLMRAECMWCR
mmetsp:Transcript_62299/g.148731  ORF Transcript_62299/g.148731 Transcript_62299/m.148731 type:complete len:350 (+) Transcript_62299:69-1118(+)